MIPIIDIGVIADKRGDVSESCLYEEINKAFCETGIIQLVNHGISQQVFKTMEALAVEFFDLSEAEKNQVSYRAPVPRGYSGCAKENFACLAGARKPNDLVEKFRIGPYGIPVDPSDPNYYYYHQDKRAKALFYENKWPDKPDTFRQHVEHYYALMEKLTLILVACFEVCLDASPGHISKKMNRHTSILSLNRYPPLSDIRQIQKGQLRLAQHTDVDLFTIVYQSHGGLEVLIRDEWIPVPHIPGSLIINIGDALSYWTDNRWKSTVHRVILPHEKATANSNRYSMGYFVGANYDAILKTFDNRNETYVELFYSEWRKQRIKTAMSEFQAKS